jgi:hypothetical protein
MYSQEGEQSVVLADPLLFGGEAPTAPVNAHDVRGISEAMPLRTGLPPGVQALAIPAPEPQFASGEKVNGPGDYGTLGAWVTTRTGQEAILTAGHVAVARTVVHDVAGNTGTVVFSVDPAQVPAAAVTADVAVVVPDTAQTQSQVPLAVTAKASAAAELTITGVASGSQNAHVMGMTPCLYVPKMSGMWGDLYFTTAGCTASGDSGGPATIAGTHQLVGHVVGASGTTTSFIQEVDFQLEAADVIFQPSA